MADFKVSYTIELTDEATGKVYRFTNAIKQADRATAGATVKLRRLAYVLSFVGRSYARHITFPLIGFGALSMKTAFDYEKSMNMVQAITRVSGKDLDDLKKLALDVGLKTRYSTAEAADGLRLMAQAGIKGKKTFTDLAWAGVRVATSAQIKFNDALEAGLGIVKAYGMRVDQVPKVMNAMLYASNSAMVVFKDVRDAMAKSAVLAENYGVNIYDLITAYEIMGDKLLKGSEAGNKFRRSFQMLAAATGAKKRMLDDVFGKYGIIEKGTGHLRRFSVILAEMKAAKMIPEFWTRILGVRAGGVWVALYKQLDAFNKQLIKMKNLHGDLAKEMMRIQMEGIPGTLWRLRSAFQNLQIAVVEADKKAILPFADDLTQLMDRMAISSYTSKRWASVLAMGAIGIQVFLSGLSGLVKVALVWAILGEKITAVFSGMALAVRGLAVGVGGLMIEIAPLVAALTAIWYAGKKIQELGWWGAFKKFLPPLEAPDELALRRLYARKHHLTHPAAGFAVAGAGVGMGWHPTMGILSPAHKVATASTVNINVHDPSKIIKSITGESTADHFNMNLGANMAGARY